MMAKNGFIPAHGGYHDLLSYRKALIIYDGTNRFCKRFLHPRDRTVDQMTQAARSGKQNIVEASKASGTSKATEIKLTNVARSSLEELREDYRDYLRVRDAPLWDKNSKEALFVRKLGARRDASYETFRTFIETRPPEVVANILVCLIHQANYLLDQQIRQLEKAFVEQGGMRERMTRARIDERNRQKGKWHPPPDKPDRQKGKWDPPTEKPGRQKGKWDPPPEKPGRQKGKWDPPPEKPGRQKGKWDPPPEKPGRQKGKWGPLPEKPE